MDIRVLFKATKCSNEEDMEISESEPANKHQRIDSDTEDSISETSTSELSCAVAAPSTPQE